MIPMMIILSIVVFCMVRLIPGDPVTMSLGMGAGKEAIAAETARLGLDKPLWQQYFIWVKNLFHGDFGTSISTHKAVLYEIGRRYPNTIKLAIGATIVFQFSSHRLENWISEICKPQNLVRQISQGIFSFYAELNLPDTVW